MSERTVVKWVRRFRQAGIAGLEDASSRPGAPAHQTPPWAVTLIQWLREQHGLPAWAIGHALRIPRSTVTVWLRRLGLNRPPVAPAVPIHRDELRSARAGDLSRLRLGEFAVRVPEQCCRDSHLLHELYRR